MKQYKIFEFDCFVELHTVNQHSITKNITSKCEGFSSKGCKSSKCFKNTEKYKKILHIANNIINKKNNNTSKGNLK